ncbi:MAG: hypothetical protein R2847_06460 [Bacteroidia bacterium]
MSCFYFGFCTSYFISSPALRVTTAGSVGAGAGATSGVVVSAEQQARCAFLLG